VARTRPVGCKTLISRQGDWGRLNDLATLRPNEQSEPGGHFRIIGAREVTRRN
jgi:hypothetical protein